MHRLTFHYRGGRRLVWLRFARTYFDTSSAANVFPAPSKRQRV